MPAVFPTTTTVSKATDTAVVNAQGAEWATVRFRYNGTATLTNTFEMSIDGTNWVASPLARLVDTAAANPTVAATYATSGAVANVTYEVALPGNCVAVRSRVSSYTSGSLTVEAFPFRPYQVGVPVCAVLAEAPAANATLTVGPFETGGWTNIAYTIIIGAATSGTVTSSIVDDLGNLATIATVGSLATGTYQGGMGPGTVIGGTTLPWGSLVNSATTVPVPNRWQMVATVATTSTQRIRVEARR